MSYDVLVDDFRFTGLQTPALTAAVVDGPWAKADTSAAGAPTLTTVNGSMVGTLAATAEVENLCLYHGDNLGYDIDDLISAEFWLSVAGVDAVTTLVCGMGSARNDTPDSVAANAWFRIEGSASLSALLAETDDGVTDTDDKATGLSLASTIRKLEIRFKDGVYSASPPANSAGGKANTLFYAENSQGLLVPVATTQRFDLSAYSGRLQPLVQVQKASGTGVPAFSLRRCRITYREPN